MPCNVTLPGGASPIPWSTKNNTIGGNLTVSGQSTEWLGVLFNTIAGNVIAYGAGGLGTALSGAPESDLLAGGGVDLALADNLSVGARYLHGFPVTGANPKNQFTIGANFHF